MGLLEGQQFGIDEVFFLGKLKACVILAVIDQWCEDTMSACSMHWHGEGFILYIKIKRFDTSKKNYLKHRIYFVVINTII